MRVPPDSFLSLTLVPLAASSGGLVTQRSQGVEKVESGTRHGYLPFPHLPPDSTHDLHQRWVAIAVVRESRGGEEGRYGG